MPGPETADQLGFVARLRGDLSATDRSSRASLGDVIATGLRQGILEGHIPPGTWFNEGLLATALGVSRTPVREALRTLDGQLLTVRGPGNSRIVAAPSADDIIALYRVRQSLEGLAANLVASEPRPEVVKELVTIVSQMVGSLENDDAQQLTRLNRRFSTTLWNATENEYLCRFLTEVRAAVTRFGRSPLEDPEVARVYIEDRRRLCEAIERCDPDEAERLAREHSERARRQRLALLWGTSIVTSEAKPAGQQSMSHSKTRLKSVGKRDDK